MRTLAALAAVVIAGCHSQPREPWQDNRHENACGGTGEVLNVELGVAVIETPAGSEAHTVTFKSTHRGVILIDDEEKAVLRDDGLTTVDVPAGTHRLALEVEGYHRFERMLDVKPDANMFVTVR